MWNWFDMVCNTFCSKHWVSCYIHFTEALHTFGTEFSFLFQSHYTEGDCTFQELLRSDGYTFFISPHTKNPVSLPSKHSGQKHGAPLSRFLPVMNTQLAMAGKGEDSQIQEVKPYIKDINLDSDDPLGIGHQSHIQTVFSPSLHTRKWGLENISYGCMLYIISGLQGLKCFVTVFVLCPELYLFELIYLFAMV